MPAPPRGPAVVYVAQVFPTLRTTFVTDEVAGLVARGLPVAVVSVRPGDDSIPAPAPVVVLPHEATPGFWAAAARAFVRAPGAAWSTARRLVRERRGVRSGRAAWRKLAGYWLRGLALADRLARDPRLAGATHLHVHFDEYPLIAAAVAARVGRLTLSYTVHTITDVVALAFKLESAAFVVVVSRQVRAWLESQGHALGVTLPPLEHIRCGIDPERWRHLPRPPLDADAPPLVVSVGALMRVKGHRVLVEALAHLAREGLAFRAVIAGGIAEPAYAEELARTITALGLADRIQLAGAVPRARVAELLGQATVFALACLTNEEGDHDGIPVALMEAMAAGVPVVSTRLAALGELIVDGESGLLVPPGESAPLAAAIGRLLHNGGERSRLAEGGRARVTLEFDLDQQVRRLADALSKEMTR